MSELGSSKSYSSVSQSQSSHSYSSSPPPLSSDAPSSSSSSSASSSSSSDDTTCVRCGNCCYSDASKVKVTLTLDSTWFDSSNFGAPPPYDCIPIDPQLPENSWEMTLDMNPVTSTPTSVSWSGEEWTQEGYEGVQISVTSSCSGGWHVNIYRHWGDAGGGQTSITTSSTTPYHCTPVSPLAGTCCGVEGTVSVFTDGYGMGISIAGTGYLRIEVVNNPCCYDSITGQCSKHRFGDCRGDCAGDSSSSSSSDENPLP